MRAVVDIRRVSWHQQARENGPYVYRTKLQVKHTLAGPWMDIPELDTGEIVEFNGELPDIS